MGQPIACIIFGWIFMVVPSSLAQIKQNEVTRPPLPPICAFVTSDNDYGPCSVDCGGGSKNGTAKNTCDSLQTIVVIKGCNSKPCPIMAITTKPKLQECVLPDPAVLGSIPIRYLHLFFAIADFFKIQLIYEGYINAFRLQANIDGTFIQFESDNGNIHAYLSTYGSSDFTEIAALYAPSGVESAWINFAAQIFKIVPSKIVLKKS